MKVLLQETRPQHLGRYSPTRPLLSLAAAVGSRLGDKGGDIYLPGNCGNPHHG
jgi:hypothetical protein